MKIFLAGSGSVSNDLNYYNFYRLESFLLMNKKNIPLIKKYKGFILDSGAFSYMNGKDSIGIDWDEYIEKYANFIKTYNIKNYMELDIDVVVGTKEVERLRNKLEMLVGWQCIPVWHKFRGRDYWLKMVKDYDYVAIGGIVTKEIKPKEYKYFHWLLKEAKKQNCKVHGLGFTNLKGVKEYPFYSVDSTSWLSGNRFGAVYKFNGETLLKYNKSKGLRVKTKKTGENNFLEWCKFADYMESYKHYIL